MDPDETEARLKCLAMAVDLAKANLDVNPEADEVLKTADRFAAFALKGTAQ